MQPEQFALLKTELLIPNAEQPRRTFDEKSLNDLALSIKKYGMINPILVRPKENLYEIIAGERRYRAAKKIGLTEVPVIIKKVADADLTEIALTENLQKEKISAIEEAEAYDDLIKTKALDEQKLSEMMGIDQQYINNKLQLLKLPIEVKEAVNNKKISEKHAKILLTVTDENKQKELLNKIINERLSVKDLDKIINKKEEKESDNMNNGSFFPNYNNQEPNNDVSLNQMNMQTINAPVPETPAPAPAPVPEETIPAAPIIEPTPAPQPELPTAPILPQVEIQNMEPQMPVPEVNSEVTSPIPEFGVNNPLPEPPVVDNTPPVAPVVEPTPMPDMPLFNAAPTPETPAAPEVPPVPEAQTEPISPVIEPVPTNTPPAGETPLFNTELANPNSQPNLNESFYEVPVNVSPVIEAPQEDKLIKVEQLLSSNNIEYKAYSNETGHCIIIEL